jgi:hypothetical protein
MPGLPVVPLPVLRPGNGLKPADTLLFLLPGRKPGLWFPDHPIAFGAYWEIRPG